MEILRFIVDFLTLYILIYIIYSVFFNKNRKEYKNLKNNDEIKFFIKAYKIDMKKKDYSELLKTLTITNSFIIAISTTIVLYIENYFIKIIACFITLLLLIFVLYNLIGTYYKKKENEKNV